MIIKNQSHRTSHCRWPPNILALAIVVLAVLFAVACRANEAVRSANVEVDILARWETTDIAAEASEFIAHMFDDDGISDGGTLFWEFIEKYMEHVQQKESLTDRDKYELVMQIAESDLKIRGKLLTPLVKYALAMRYFSPRIETHRQLLIQSVLTIDANATLDDEMIAVVETETPEGLPWAQLAHSVIELEAVLAEATIHRGTTKQDSRPCFSFSRTNTVYPFDHPYRCPHGQLLDRNDEACQGGVRVIVYSSMLSKQFRHVHHKLKELACASNNDERVQYYFRHFDGSTKQYKNQVIERPLPLQGYGVELIVKNLEYKQMDDSLLKYKERKQQEKDVAPSETSKESNNSEEQLKNLGVQITQFVMNAYNDDQSGLSVLQDVVQNFPSFLSRVLQIKPDRATQNDIVQNQSNLGKGNGLIINGILINLEKLSVFSLYDMIASEFKWMSDLGSKLHLSSEFVTKSFLPLLWTGQNNHGSNVPRFNIFADDPEKKQVTLFINDVEKDDQYHSFPPSLKFMLAPPYFGQNRFSRRNIFQAIYIADISNKKSLEMVAAALSTYQRGMPAQFGFLFFDGEDLQDHINQQREKKTASAFADVNLEGASSVRFSSNEIPDQATNFKCDSNSAAAAFSAAFQYIISKPHLKRLLSPFVFQLLRNSDEVLQPSLVKQVFSSTAGKSLDQVISENVEFINICSKTGQLAIRTGIRKAAPAMLLNGRMFTESDTRVQDYINTGIFKYEYHVVKDLIKNNKIKDSDSYISHKILEQFSGVLKRYNPNALQSNPHFTTIMNADILQDVPFLHSPRSLEGIDQMFTYFLVVDFGNSASRRLLSHAISWLSSAESSPRSRIALVPLPSNSDSSKTISQIIMDTLTFDNVTMVEQTLHTVEETLAIAGNEESITRAGILERIPQTTKALLNMRDTILDMQAYLSQMTRVLQISRESQRKMIILNGQKIEFSSEDDLSEFGPEDFMTVERVERARIKQLCEQFESYTDFQDIDADRQTTAWRSNILLGMMSMLGAIQTDQNGQRTMLSLEDIIPERVTMSFNQQEEGLLPLVTVVVDPLDDEAQKLTALTRVLSENFGLPVTVVFNPPLTVDGAPILRKLWYRFVVEPELRFHENNGSLITPTAEFDSMPANQNILTMNMHVPETWLIELVHSTEDLDNINLANMIDYSDKNTLQAHYHLENIIVTGSCEDPNGRSSTRGLQFVMGDSLHARMQDTLVMANYGYFQLKASPNVWKMRLAPGRHSQVFQIVEYASSTAYDQQHPSWSHSPENGTTATVVLNSFDGPFLHLNVERRKGMEQADLFEKSKQNSQDENDGVWNRVKSFLAESPDEKPDVINVFSIVSGHMYERLLKIMILSVVKNTKKKPVKFWIIKNYISPQFKTFLPIMAERYGFDYEFVTYKWPTWLNKQTEKQRLIWAYKILFLDVLFPLDVHKVIYVDADQITRADLTELWDMDLEGKPLAYTPFCSDRTEMDGYRFWNQGYWKSHLRGKPYHISALYVVDIDRLRSVYGGDQLRFYYDSLSKDPNSLSNLDQDLPNYAQHLVPIYSLPQEWLWCETWCSDASKAKAKTIDLCNNPDTKEHKLESARRIIPEWEDYDKEIAQLNKEVIP